jgi:hypothetical protein
MDAVSQQTLERIFSEFAQLGEQLGPPAPRLWEDARHFFLKSQGKRVSAERKERLIRAAVVLASAAFEGWTNFLAGELLQNGQLLVGRKLTDDEADRLFERRKRYSAKSRFLLLCRIFNGGREPGSSICETLSFSFETRDEIVHPKPGKFAEILRSGPGWKAFSGFLVADIFLARLWAKANSSHRLATRRGR